MSRKEGSLEAPTRHPIDWQGPDYYDDAKLMAELERVYDICHGCRRCVSLCQSFPTLFDLVDESDTMEVDGVDKGDYYKVVDHCYLCDLCFMTKCPYVPPHEWGVDFPHLMLQAKAQRFHKSGARFRDRVLTNTDAMGKFASSPGISQMMSGLGNTEVFRVSLEKTLGVHRDAPLPRYSRPTLEQRAQEQVQTIPPTPVGDTSGKVALFATCFANYTQAELADDFMKVFQHNDIQIEPATSLQCCGMPKLEIGDMESVARLKAHNIPRLAELVRQGYDLIAPIPSCVLMFKQELPLMFPDDEEVALVQRAFFDPFEYLWLRHKGGKLKTEFTQPLGNITYQPACHQRVQNFGPRTRDILALIPDTQVHTIERCSGHDGTYAVKLETREASLKIARPVVRQVDRTQPDHHVSDCPMAASHIGSQRTGLGDKPGNALHPISLLRQAYGL
ncbi:heterodisulfide reductase-related iron-sulfur binding cluster [Ferrimonas balearica]|uniref:heterodisulfide reductase-related iron-sulfur binding cluster n=1 Tax=Ferrimonas balearica TaxID=44012 RepID=UPI001C990C4A|nr:heterodisulfide reductase-related iron-sulfur binding cluster [Ferrimonas balearica]MBY5920556.1 Fe-S oxidoreductase [Ferrimonas balearica]MBY5996759.1 Fe-S oxidoreductase [Ferrimonas balearica]